MPPECWKTQLLAQDCAFAARSSLQLSGPTPCCERTELCAKRYAAMSLSDVSFGTRGLAVATARREARAKKGLNSILAEEWAGEGREEARVNEKRKREEKWISVGAHA